MSKIMKDIKYYNIPGFSKDTLKKSCQVIILMILCIKVHTNYSFCQLPDKMNISNHVTGTVLDQATRSITLSPGFTYKAQAEHYFVAQITGYHGKDGSARVLGDMNETLGSTLNQDKKLLDDSLNNNIIWIYPNPTSGRFTIEVMHDPQGSNSFVQVYSIIGNVIGSVPVAETSTNIDISGYPDGIYIINIVLSGHITTRKIIKE
jgi:hypothetical protein